MAGAAARRAAWRAALGVTAAAAGYFGGSILGLSFPFPGTQISALWPPNAILLAVLLVAPRRQWWLYLLAIVPAHLLAQSLMGLPLQAVLINLAGNTAEALLGALLILHLLGEPRRLDRLRGVMLIMLVGGILAPALVSLAVAQLFAGFGMTIDSWLTWRLRLLTNTLAVFTLVPPIVLAVTGARSPRHAVSRVRAAEAAALLASLLAVGFFVFALPQAGPGQSAVLLYAPFPLLLWATVRFGLPGASLSVLALGVISTLGAVQGHGPFTAQQPIENATALVLFLTVTSAPLLMLAALLEERESAEEERQHEQTLHSAVLASVHDHIAVIDREGVLLEVNEAWTEFARSIGVNPLATVMEGANYLAVCRAAAKATDDSAARALTGIEAVLHGGQEHYQMEYECRTPERRLWFEMSVEGLKRPGGGAVITYADVTSRKQAELEAQVQRRELAHLTRVAMLGQLSGALAHELNQPLTAILSNAQAAIRLLAREPVDLAEVRDIVRDIADDDRRAGQVIQRLRAMLKKGEAKMQPLDLNELVGEVLALAHSDLITRNILVTTRLAPALPAACGDRVQLQQVLLNLLLNGCEAMSATPTGERRLLMVTGRDGSDGLQVLVSDRGPGITADAMERVFEPFYTTKEHGLGLGLPISRSLVEALGGRLWASNNEDLGATFHLTLPPCGGKPR